MKAEDGGDGGLPIKQSKKDRNFDYDKSGKIYSEGYDHLEYFLIYCCYIQLHCYTKILLLLQILKYQI